ncbi:hypothetical protein K474DRAFT_1686279 [Panus rudis PR-1116 ss-1]|nr:hypothetical protein K474DRAFT_1686279 [Panus rudis PR-1116 ss-1]
MRLPESIASQEATISALNNEAKVLRSRLVSLVDEINEVHPRLEKELLTALETLPPILEAERGARYDVLSLTIETCLLKLSLMRARMHQTVYGYTSPKKPDATMARALEAVHHKLQKKREEQEREERELDRQIREYEELLAMVDGRGGGFKQIVEDMARVKRDTEECRKDLRRLGWTGD